MEHFHTKHIKYSLPEALTRSFAYHTAGESVQQLSPRDVHLSAMPSIRLIDSINGHELQMTYAYIVQMCSAAIWTEVKRNHQLVQ